MRALLFYLLRTYNGVTIYPNDVHAPPPLPKCGGVTVLAYKLLYENRYAMTFGGRNTLKNTWSMYLLLDMDNHQNKHIVGIHCIYHTTSPSIVLTHSNQSRL